jgi:hypothetical protein
MRKELVPKFKVNDFIIYSTPDGNIKVDALLQNETIWLTQKRMAELFQVSVPTINEHLRNIFLSKELIENSTIRNFRIVQKEVQSFLFEDQANYQSC